MPPSGPGSSACCLALPLKPEASIQRSCDALKPAGCFPFSTSQMGVAASPESLPAKTASARRESLIGKFRRLL